MSPPDGHWHRRKYQENDDAGITMFGCTEPGCDFIGFIHPTRVEEWPGQESPSERTRRLHLQNKAAHDARAKTQWKV